MAKVLLFGDDGQIGWELSRLLSPRHEVVGLSYPHVDFQDAVALRDIVRDAAPDLVINAAAYTAVDRAESDEAAARAINGVAPGIIAEEAACCGALMVHYSTDFVFDGSKGAPCDETDTPAPLSVYGATKLEGDRAVQAVGGRHLIFRVSWIYGLRGGNFLLTIRHLASEGKALRIVSDQVGAPTWCRSVAEGTVGAVHQCVGPQATPRAEALSGLYHMTCGGETSWHGFARAFLPSETALAPISTEEYPTPARRPPYSVLNCDRLERTFGVRLPAWDVALRTCLVGDR